MEDIPLPRRLGNFFILAGLLLVILFTLSYAGQSAQPLFLLGGGAALWIGYRLRRKTAPPPTSNRFRLLRQMREKARQRRAQRQSPPPKAERPR
jgi:hypothetical protein